MEHRLTCINCPLGCSLGITEQQEGYLVTGNKCAKGEAYAINEITFPLRFIASTVAVRGGSRRVVSVKVNGAIPKAKIFQCMETIGKLSAEAPVHLGDVLLSDIADTGMSVVATASVLSD